eukprot:s3704_g2.t2
MSFRPGCMLSSVAFGELLAALAPQLEARLSSDGFRARDVAKVCKAYSALRFHDAAHISALVACCRFTLDEASAADLAQLAEAAMRGGVRDADAFLKEAAMLATKRAAFMLPFEMGLCAITFGASAADFLAKSPSSELAMEAAVASAELLHAICRAAASAAPRLQPQQGLPGRSPGFVAPGQMSCLSYHGYPQHSHGVGAGTGELHICSVDGEVAACLDMQELQEMVQTRGDTVRALKEHLCLLLAVSRFRQRLIFQDRVLEDEEVLFDLMMDLELPTSLQLVVIPFSPANARDLQALLRCAEADKDMERLLKMPLEPDLTLPDGRSALQVSAHSGSSNSARLLLEARASIDSKDPRGMSILGIACETGSSSVAQIVVEAGHCVDAVSPTGDTPLSIACGKGHLKVVRLLLAAGANKNRANNEEASPLWRASMEGHLDIVQELLQARANTNQADRTGKSPCWVASSNGHLDVLTLLLEARAEINAVDATGTSPVWFAARQGYLEIVRLLANTKACVNTANKSTGATALWIAASRGHLRMVQLLVLLRANLDQTRPPTDTSPLWVASANAHLPTVRLLIEAVADVSKADHSGTSPQEIASLNGHVDLTRFWNGLRTRTG